jgi:hypothetical protein
MTAGSALKGLRLAGSTATGGLSLAQEKNNNDAVKIRIGDSLMR